MRTVCWSLVGVFFLGAAPLAQADEGDGLMLPRIQGRVRLGMGVEPGVMGLSNGSTNLARLRSASVLGDYYFSRVAEREGDSSGFRATTGVFFGAQLGTVGGYAPSTLGSSLFSVERYSFSLLAPPRSAELANQDSSTVPYLGLGYSSVSAKGGWGFSADFGLMALNPGNAVRLGRVFGSGQNLEDVLRDLRLSPLVQLGVSYQF